MAFRSFFEGAFKSVKDWIETNLSGGQWLEAEPTELQDALADQGLDLSDEEFGTISDDFLAERLSAEDIADLSLSNFVPDSWIQQRPTWNLAENYLYRVRVEGSTGLTGEQQTRYYSLYSNEPLTVGDVVDAIDDIILDRAEEYDFSADSFQLVNVYSR